MSLEACLFEKSSIVLEGLARVAEEVRRLPTGSLAEREVGAHLIVALRPGTPECNRRSRKRFSAPTNEIRV